MALTFPIALDDFFRGLGVVEATFTPFSPKNGNVTGGGEIVTVARGLPRWQGTISVRPDTHANVQELTAKANLLQTDPDASFFISDFRRKGPSLDPQGVIMDTSTPTIVTIDANSRDIQITGLPVGYELKAGDYVAFEYGSPARYALHEVVEGRTSDGSGDIAQLEVLPPLRPGVTVGTALEFINPSCRAKMVPGSFRAPRQQAAYSQGFSFSWVQSIR